MRDLVVFHRVEFIAPEIFSFTDAVNVSKNFGYTYFIFLRIST